MYMMLSYNVWQEGYVWIIMISIPLIHRDIIILLWGAIMTKLTGVIHHPKVTRTLDSRIMSAGVIYREKKIPWVDVGSMLAQHLRSWINIEPTGDWRDHCQAALDAHIIWAVS